MARLEACLTVFKNEKLNGSIVRTEEALSEIDAILCPVEVEEVTVERWAVVDPYGYVETTYGDESKAKELVTMPNGRYEKYEIVKLTGVHRREKKVVERRAEATIMTRSTIGGSMWLEIPANSEYPAAGTTVNLEWTE